RSRGPRVVVLLAQHRGQQAEEADVLLRVVRLPHAQLEIGQARRVELTERPRPVRRARGVAARGDDQQDGGDGPVQVLPQLFTCGTACRSSGRMRRFIARRTAFSDPGRTKIAVRPTVPAVARLIIAAAPISWNDSIRNSSPKP